VRNFLLVAYHFPPQSGSSGLLRSLKFCRNLLSHGWCATVLSTHSRTYERLDTRQCSEIPPQVSVIRSFALDASRHLSIGGRYPRFFALPDRWVSWCLGAIPSGYRAIRKHRIEIIFTTHPIATAILIGWALHRLTDKPWVVDFRDLMTEDDYPTDPLTFRVYRWIERKVIRYAARIIFTAPSAIDAYTARYPQLDRRKCLLIPNGYDEEDFRDLPQNALAEASPGTPLRLLHSGLIYPSERDPRPFFRALSHLKKEGSLDARQVLIELRASGSEDLYSRMISELKIDDIVSLLPPLPYQASLREGAAADALLLLQATSCARQIPAKAYEYLRLRKPILALTNDDGDTARLLRETGGATIVPLDDEDAIVRALPDFLQSLRDGNHALPEDAQVRRFSRHQQAADLARCFDEVASRDPLRQSAMNELRDPT
jgi:glycosyltransferase involved in cell wall biosynthesis